MVADGNSAGAPIHAIARFHGRDLMRIREGEPVAERDHHGDRPEEDAPAEGRTAEELTPDTGKPVSKLNLGRFGAGFIFFCIVFMMSGTIGSTVLLPARFNRSGRNDPRHDELHRHHLRPDLQRHLRLAVRRLPQPFRQAHAMDHHRRTDRRHRILPDLHLPRRCRPSSPPGHCCRSA